MKWILKTGWMAIFLALVCAHAPRAYAAVFALSEVFNNSPSVGASNSLWQQITNAAYPTSYTCTQSNDFRRWRGAFTANSATTKLGVHADDDAQVKINGTTAIGFHGQNEHLQNSSSLRLISYTFTPGIEYCVEVEYTNHLHEANDADGVTLYAYNGGGSVRDGIAVWGPDYIGLGCTATLSACGDASFSWSSSSPAVANGGGTGGSITASASAVGTTTFTATDANGKSGNRTITVVKLGLNPSSFLICAGTPQTLVLTNAEINSGITWSPAGTVSANTRTNTLILTTPGSTIITSRWNNCEAYATGVLYQVASVTANPNNICGAGSVLYTATTTPGGYEGYLTWAGDGLTYVDWDKRSATYSTPGARTVSAYCGNSTGTVTVTVHKINVTNTVEYGLVGSATPVNFYLSADSVGPYTWQVTPSGGPSISGGSSGSSVSILPGSTPGDYTIKALATPLPSCNDTSTLQVVQVTFSTNAVALCEGGTGNLTVTVNPSSALSLLTFDTVTNASAGSANTHAHIGISGTNLTVYGDNPGTATLRVRLGTTTIYGPTLTIVRVTFPSEVWYVGVGKDATNTVTIIPTNAPVTFDTASNAIATATSVAGGVKLTGVAPGTTQVRAKVGGGAVCATKDVTAVRVTFPTNETVQCSGTSLVVPVTIEPTNAPVTFTSSNITVVTVALNGTNIVLSALTNGSAFIMAKIGAHELASLAAIAVTVKLPTNELFGIQGAVTTYLLPTPPQEYSSRIQFSVANSNIASATVAGTPPRLTITGFTNGTTTITATVGMASITDGYEVA